MESTKSVTGGDINSIARGMECRQDLPFQLGPSVKKLLGYPTFFDGLLQLEIGKLQFLHGVIP